MSYAIVVSSRTGNTKKLADIILDTLKEKEVLYCGEISEEAQKADVLFIGFWTDKGTCDEPMQNFLHGLKGKQIFLFGTAGFGQSQEYFHQILERVKKEIPEGNEMIGSYMCQGKMPLSVRNRYEKLLPQEPEKMKALIRNFDKAFEDVLAHPSAVRKLKVWWTVGEYAKGFTLEARDEDEVSVTLSFPYPKELSRSPQAENVRLQLSKLGNTPFESAGVEWKGCADWFVPSSVWAEWRRTTVEALLSARKMNYARPVRLLPTEYTRSLGTEKAGTARAFVPERLTYLANVMNHKAGAFYRRQGASDIEPAFELREPEGAALMFCRHCLRYSLGWCPRYGHGKSPFREPYYLVSADGRRFRLAFDCENCQMIVYADEKK